MHSRGACVVGACMVGEHAWQGDMCGGCVWQGACMVEACGRGHALKCNNTKQLYLSFVCCS